MPYTMHTFHSLACSPLARSCTISYILKICLSLTVATQNNKINVSQIVFVPDVPSNDNQQVNYNIIYVQFKVGKTYY